MKLVLSLSYLLNCLTSLNSFRQFTRNCWSSICWPPNSITCISCKQGSKNQEVMSGEAKVPYPKGIPLILTTEFCERFSYYGMRAILVLFVHNVIHLSETNSSVLFHGFTFVAYATPIFGAILADSFIGIPRIKIHFVIFHFLRKIQHNILSFSALCCWTNCHCDFISKMGYRRIGNAVSMIKECRLPDNFGQIF